MSGEATDLERFVRAQDERSTYEQAVAELRAGRKLSHWMWFVFPQITGLGDSAMSRRYAISSLREAKAYVRHPVLGARLLECTRILLDSCSQSAQAILGAIDARKLRSSLTLFACAEPQNPLFAQTLERYFKEGMDPATLDRLAQLERAH